MRPEEWYRQVERSIKNLQDVGSGFSQGELVKAHFNTPNTIILYKMYNIGTSLEYTDGSLPMVYLGYEHHVDPIVEVADTMKCVTHFFLHLGVVWTFTRAFRRNEAENPTQWRSYKPQNLRPWFRKVEPQDA